MHVLHVVGARPNFMKAAPVLRALAEQAEAAHTLAEHKEVRQTLVHTGQHYDAAMSGVFFQQLEMPPPDFNLEVGSGTHAQQTAAVMQAFEPVLHECKPDLVLVYGDVNSTVAAALVCAKLRVPLGHVEAGLRSFDRTMPEEINRLLTDQLSDLLFTPSPDGGENLRREGIEASKIHHVGNVMIDTLVRLLPQAENHFPAGIPSPYALVTLHRPANVDDLDWLRELLATLADLSAQLNVIFPVHPRTRQRLEELGSRASSTQTSSAQTGSTQKSSTQKSSAHRANSRLHLMEPLPYLEFLALQKRAALVITDSGGVQEETTFLGVPCLTVRENTERPITLTQGTNQLVGRDLRKLQLAATEVLKRNSDQEDEDRKHENRKDEKRSNNDRVPLWDGHAADRIAQIIVRSSAHSNVG